MNDKSVDKNKKSVKKNTNASSKKKTSKKTNIKNVEKKIEQSIKVTSKSAVDNEKIVCETKENKFGFFEYALLIIIASLVFSVLGYFIGLKGNNNLIDDYATANQNLREFIEEYNYILENYYGEVDETELISSAIEGMLSSIDNYSGFIGKDSNNDSISLKGEYVGLGIGVLNNNDGNIVIATIYDNSPASKSGLKVGDVVLKINDEDFTGRDNKEVVSKIDELEEVKLTIKRSEEELTFDLKKDKIIIKSVAYEMLENNIGYIQVGLFAENTDEQFSEALVELESKDLKSLIIDLRGNVGGHLSSVKNMISQFLDDSHIIYHTENEQGIEKVYSNGNKDKEYKIVILQDLTSASASEVMASALREQLNAYIIGNTSFGKGTVQTVRNIDGIGEYKVTTMKWLTSNGVWIDGTGIVPDLEVSLNEAYYKEPIRKNDNQLNSAIEYLKKIED